jgi:flagellar protein FlgJ
MEIPSIQRSVQASDIAPERLAGNPSLTQDQKIAEASRQFEAILVKQILDSSQKTVIQSKFADNSTASSIYNDMISTQLSESISKSGRFGMAKVFEQQLTPHAHAHAAAAHLTQAAAAPISAKLSGHVHAAAPNAHAHDHPKQGKSLKPLISTPESVTKP